MAAGLTLSLENLDAFRTAFCAVAQEVIAPESLNMELASDGPLQAPEINRGLAEALQQAGPWGQGFAEPVFDNTFRVLEWRVLGETHLKFVLEHVEGGPAIAAIHFGGWAGQAPPLQIHAAYQLVLDDYRGRRDVQLVLRQWQAA